MEGIRQQVRTTIKQTSATHKTSSLPSSQSCDSSSPRAGLCRSRHIGSRYSGTIDNIGDLNKNTRHIDCTIYQLIVKPTAGQRMYRHIVSLKTCTTCVLAIISECRNRFYLLHLYVEISGGNRRICTYRLTCYRIPLPDYLQHFIYR